MGRVANRVKVLHFEHLYIVSSRVGPPIPHLSLPLSGDPSLSETNLKSYPLFLRAIQIDVCKLYETL